MKSQKAYQRGGSIPLLLYADSTYEDGVYWGTVTIELATLLGVGSTFSYIVLISDEDNNAPSNTVLASSTLSNIILTSATPIPGAF